VAAGHSGLTRNQTKRKWISPTVKTMNSSGMIPVITLGHTMTGKTNRAKRLQRLQAVIRIMGQIVDSQVAAEVEGYGLVTPDAARTILEELAGVK